MCISQTLIETIFVWIFIFHVYTPIYFHRSLSYDMNMKNNKIYCNSLILKQVSERLVQRHIICK